MNWYAMFFGVVLLIFSVPPLFSKPLRERHVARSTRQLSVLRLATGADQATQFWARLTTWAWLIGAVCFGVIFVGVSLVGWIY